ncbi:hypothetical protein BJF93_15305 [Xaviernesmea oryzae]|uniref:Lipoprotein n=1 Tax=Xaviernesmea oryzae TaxID=464029 RepID=A0A1Q9AXY9_9HYPH|nr:hypothetical protein [Xaviernesmea oryzae]OLP60322.1 hypothetical protein BJF93_15305 [Xaviernesmea oryzae]SEK23349.1 hypothetical protein SAMN04487976_101158 [Xaviernesmea oryzae]
MPRRLLGAAVALLALAGCQTSQEYQAAIDESLNARLEALNGLTIGQFTAQTGMLPADAYPVQGGRVFVFRTDPVMITLPATKVTPAITRTAQCQLLIQTKATDSRGTADSWKIVATQRAGACNNLPI